MDAGDVYICKNRMALPSVCLFAGLTAKFCGATNMHTKIKPLTTPRRYVAAVLQANSGAAIR